MPIGEDVFFPVRECRAEQESPSYLPQVDRYLGELVATSV
jgi:hypothetical protein